MQHTSKEPFVKAISDHGVTRFELKRWMESARGLTAGITSRIGGVSAAPYDELNCGLHVGDDAEDVICNRKRVAESAGFPFDGWTCAEQVHGNRIEIVKANDRGRGRLSRESAIQHADGLVTNEKGVILTAVYADCVPLYFHDRKHGVVALAHAGWKGTVLEIAAAVVQVMSERFGSRPERIDAAIGPSIGGCCYEVDSRVANPILELHRKGRLLSPPKDSFPTGLTAKPGDRYDLDLKEMNRQIMIKAGIDPKRIELSSKCTGCERHSFFSHRMENGRTGRMVGWIGIVDRGEV